MMTNDTLPELRAMLDRQEQPDKAVAPKSEK